MSEKDLKNLRSCLASNAMEGFEVNEQTEKDCVRVLSGEISLNDLFAEIIARK